MTLSFLLGSFHGMDRAHRRFRDVEAEMLFEVYDLLKTEQAKSEFRAAMHELMIKTIKEFTKLKGKYKK